MRDIDRSQLRKTLTLSILTSRRVTRGRIRKEELRVRMEKGLRIAESRKLRQKKGKHQTRNLPVHAEPSETRRMTAVL